MFTLTQAHIDKLNNHFNGERRTYRPAMTHLKVGFKYVQNEHGESKKVGARPVLQRITALYMSGKVRTNTGDVFDIQLGSGPGHVFKAVA